MDKSQIQRDNKGFTIHQWKLISLEMLDIYTLLFNNNLLQSVSIFHHG